MSLYIRAFLFLLSSIFGSRLALLDDFIMFILIISVIISWIMSRLLLQLIPDGLFGDSQWETTAE